jgi:hypothetical protein
MSKARRAIGHQDLGSDEQPLPITSYAGDVTPQRRRAHLFKYLFLFQSSPRSAAAWTISYTRLLHRYTPKASKIRDTAP